MNGLIEKWKAERDRSAFLALDDGAVFHGVAFGAAKDALGEVVFNTGMSGYQEILTDPSYAGQFVEPRPFPVGTRHRRPDGAQQLAERKEPRRIPEGERSSWNLRRRHPRPHPAHQGARQPQGVFES